MKRFCLLIGLLLSISVNAQVDIKRQGYYQVIVSDTVYSQHSQEYQAIETLLNLKFEGIDADVIAPSLTVTAEPIGVAPDTIREIVEIPVYVTDTIYIEGENVVDGVEYEGQFYPLTDIHFTPEITRDTIVDIECFEDYNEKIWLWTDESHVWIPFKGQGLSHVAVDSLPIWKKKYQNKWRLERVKDHKQTRIFYKELDIPFQFYVKDSVVSVEPTVARLRVFGNEDWFPQVIVDEVPREPLYDATPGFQDFHGVTTRRHSITVDGLTPGTTHNIRIIGFQREGEETDYADFVIETPQ